MRMEGVYLSSNCPLLTAHKKANKNPTATNKLAEIKIIIALKMSTFLKKNPFVLMLFDATLAATH